MFLLAYFPPSNIARTIYEVKREVYRRWGSPSAIALPALVPLKVFDQQPEQSELQKTYNLRGHRFTTSTYRSEGNNIFLQIDMGSIPPVQADLYFPLSHGVHIVQCEHEALPLDKLFGGLGPPPDLGWTGGEFSLLLVTLGNEKKSWWRCLRWEEIFAYKVLKEKKIKD